MSDLSEREKKFVAALLTAEQTFAGYAHLHIAKETLDGYVKALNNLKLAIAMRTALGPFSHSSLKET